MQQYTYMVGKLIRV